MKTKHMALLTLFGFLLVIGLSAPQLQAQQPTLSKFDEFAAAQAQANSKPGDRQVPPKTIAVPTAEVSPQEQALMAGPFPPHMNANPKTAAEWKELINRRAAVLINNLPMLKDKLGVSWEAVTIAGVKAFLVTPKELPPQNRNRLLVHVHGGGYVFAPGET